MQQLIKSCPNLISKQLDGLRSNRNDEDLIWIPFNTPSLKNSKVKTSRGIFASKTVKKYLTALGIQKYSPSRKEVVGYAKKPNLFEEIRDKFEESLIDVPQPYLLGMHFVRNSKRDFDFNNASQIIQDLLVAHDMLEDDCTRVLLPLPMIVDGSFVSYDKENPGVFIKILK